VKTSVIYCSYDLRPVTDDELQKINARIDNKIVRRRQQQHEQEQQSKQSQIKPAPSRSSPSTTYNPSHSLMNSTASSSKDEEYSIFRDPPTNASPAITTRVILFSIFYPIFLFLLLATTRTIKNVS
jgi:hypothetical protein